MRKSLKVLTGLAAATVVMSAQAAPINVGGVVWDPDSIFDFSATDTMIETIVVDVGDALSGYAKIVTVNNTLEATFCPGCELTYVFDGYTVISNTAGPSGTDLVFTGGSIRVFVDDTPNFDGFLQSTAADGTLWLELAGVTHFDVSTGALGTLHSDPTPASAGIAGDGRGFLNVVGGLAAGFFDPEAFAIDTNGDGIADGFAAFQFTSSFQLIPGGTFVSDDGVTYGIFGSNEIQSRSVVPEPGTLSLLGIALLGVAAMRRRLGSSEKV